MDFRKYLPLYQQAADENEFPVAYFANLGGTESSHRNVPAGDKRETAYGVLQQNKPWFDTFARRYGYTGTWEMFKEDPAAQIGLGGRWWGDSRKGLKAAYPDMSEGELAEVLAFSWNTGTSRTPEEMVRAFTQGGGAYDESGRAHNTAYRKRMLKTIRLLGGEVAARGVDSGGPWFPSTVGASSGPAPVSGEKALPEDVRLVPRLPAEDEYVYQRKVETEEGAPGFEGPIRKESGSVDWLLGDSKTAKATRAVAIMGAAGLMSFLGRGRERKRYGSAMASGGQVVDPYAAAMAYRNRGGRF